jgi:aminotransferase
MINIHEPHISLSDKFEILKALSTIWIGKGKKVQQFEKNLQEYLQLNNVITITSGTQGLYEIFRLLKSKTQKKEIIVSSLSFIGVLSSLKTNDFDFVYADIDKSHLSLSLKSINQKITQNTAAVLIQHYGGRPNYEIEKIAKTLKQKNIYLIEDCATVFGGTINNTHLGSYGDFSIWSFDCMKIITTLDGGAIYCKNSDDLQKIKENIHFGLVDSPTSYSAFEKKNQWWEINPQSYGTRSILNDVTASLGISQLKKIKKFIKHQQDIYNFYFNNIKNRKISFPIESPPHIKESYLFFWILSPERDQLSQFLKRNGIFSTFRYYPLHKTELYHKENVFLPNTDFIYQKLLCIPCHKNLTSKDLKHIVSTINKFKG